MSSLSCGVLLTSRGFLYLTVLSYPHLGSFPVAQTVKSLPAMQETWVQSLGREDPLEKEMATHSSILAWDNPMDRSAWWAIVHGVTKSQT